MLYMTILSWDPDKRNEVIERVKKNGLEHEGMKVIGTWVDAALGRCFQLTEIPRDINPTLLLKANFAWNDVMKIESIPVLEAAELIKFLATVKLA
jgi:hypothetical protein